MMKFIRTIWEAPQKLAAQIVIKLFKASYVADWREAKVYKW